MASNLAAMAAELVTWLVLHGRSTAGGLRVLSASSVTQLRGRVNCLLGAWIEARRETPVSGMVDAGVQRLIDACGWRDGIDRRIDLLLANWEQGIAPNWPIPDDVASNPERLAAIIDAVESLGKSDEVAYLTGLIGSHQNRFEAAVSVVKTFLSSEDEARRYVLANFAKRQLLLDAMQSGNASMAEVERIRTEAMQAVTEMRVMIDDAEKRRALSKAEVVPTVSPTITGDGDEERLGDTLEWSRPIPQKTLRGWLDVSHGTLKKLLVYNDLRGESGKYRARSRTKHAKLVEVVIADFPATIQEKLRNKASLK